LSIFIAKVLVSGFGSAIRPAKWVQQGASYRPHACHLRLVSIRINFQRVEMRVLRCKLVAHNRRCDTPAEALPFWHKTLRHQRLLPG
jgi:hypothetical protein